MNINRNALKMSFLLIFILNLVLAFAIWLRSSSEGTVFYVFGSGGWKETLSGISGVRIHTLMQVDPLGAMSAVVMGFVALIAALRSLADKKHAFSPTKAAFYLLTLCGIQGIFYSNGLFSLFLFIAVAQIGASGLYRGVPADRSVFWCSVWYYISRAILLLMFLSGTMILYLHYKTDNIATLSAVIRSGPFELLAFALLVVPLFFLFIKPSSYVTDAGRRCFFGIRAQAAFFVVFRIVFFLFGPMKGLEKMPGFFIILGLLSLASAVIFSAKERDPVKFADCMEMYMKGFMLVSLGISINGTFSAESAARYGLGALEGMVSLWMIFLPVSAALSVICCLLKEKTDGVELWCRRGLWRKLPYTGTALFLTVCVMAGLPPFAGFAAKQFLLRSSNFISPFLMAALFMASILLLLTGLRYIGELMFGRAMEEGTACFDGDIAIALPLLLLFLIFTFATAAPGRFFEIAVSPSAESLINRGQHIVNTIRQDGALR